MKSQKLLTLILTLVLLTASGGVGRAQNQTVTEEIISIIRQDCGGYSDCYTSLSAWEADYGGIDFAGNQPGDLVAADKIAVARIEGTWTLADTQPLNLSGWTTDADHYIRIYTTVEAQHDGTVGSGYRLVTTGDRPIYGGVAYFRVEGLEIHGLYDGSLVYVRPYAGEGVGDIHLSHNLIHGNGVDTGSGIYIYDYTGVLKAWNNIIYDVGAIGYLGSIQTSAGASYIYNNTIIDVIEGFAIRSGGMVVAKNNLTEAPNDDFYGIFYPGSDFNASSDGSAPGFNSRIDQTFAFVDSGNDNFHLAATDTGARNYGTDLSTDAQIAFADDVDGDARTGGWDIGADEASTGTDTVPPLRSDGAPSGILPSDTTQVTLYLATNESATCRYATSPGVSFAAMPNTFAVTGSITHTHPVAGLVDEQTYTYYVRCQDTAGSANDDDYKISFYIFSSDTVPPVISNVQAINVSPYSAEISWETDEDCTSQVEYGETGAYDTITPITSTRVTSHSVTLAGLYPETTYHFRVRSQDVAYNETASGHYTSTTTVLDSFFYVDQNHPQASDENPGTESEPWLTIQHAADVAQSGDTIIVYPGSYDRVAIREGGSPGNYITYKGLNVPDQSLVDPNAIFDPDNPTQVPSNPTVNAVTRGFVLQPAYPSTVPIVYVRIENFEITDIHGGGDSGQGGIFLGNTERVEIVRNFVHELNPDPSSYGYVGVRASSHDNANTVIKGNTLYRVQGTGISIVGRNWVVEGNELSHGLDVNTDTGAEVGGDSDAMRFFGSGHVIRNNYMHDYLDEEQYGDPHIDCFQTFSVWPDSQFAHHILVEGNICDNFGQMFMVEDQSESSGTGNAVHHITFRNNILRGARAIAFNGSVDHFTFVNNVVAESHYGAIGLGRSPYLTVLNNIFYNNGGGSQIGDQDTKVGTVWDYNIHYPDFDWPPKQPEYDQHSTFGVDPRFVGPAAGDFYLRVNSPAIDAGITLHEFSYDMNVVSRPQGWAWDIGAHEAVPEVDLLGIPDDQAIHLNWTVNITPPLTSTWQIDYASETGTVLVPPISLTGTAHSHTITGLTNFVWYTVTLNAMLDSTPLMTNTVTVMPTNIFVCLPLVLRYH
ncbi:MAG: hypothetical protein GY832_16285 [Chloroflexi bacterium]|nr:hypothetical protein [Chloroflexota bacterium]